MIFIWQHASFEYMAATQCKLVNLARATPPSLSYDSLQLFDEELRRCFWTCIAVDISDDHWQQAQLSLSFGGLGFRPVPDYPPRHWASAWGYSPGVRMQPLGRTKRARQVCMWCVVRPQKTYIHVQETTNIIIGQCMSLPAWNY